MGDCGGVRHWTAPVEPIGYHARAIGHSAFSVVGLQMEIGMIRVEGGPDEDQVHSRVLLAATPMVIGGILASGSSALAQSSNGPCSNLTLSGDYGFTIAGDLILGLTGRTSRSGPCPCNISMAEAI
jgi:hypothetical protein